MSEKRQLTPDLTLDKAVELVKQSEQVKGQLSEVAYRRAVHNDKQTQKWTKQRGLNKMTECEQDASDVVMLKNVAAVGS
jgi:hypothetical protein